MWEYTDKVRDHYLNPRNVGEIENADGVGEVGNITCGDALRFSFKLGPDGRIVDARFKTFGCGSAIATASILTEIVRGKTLEEAARITNKDIAQELGGLPKEKMHCSVMGQEALEAAIGFYKSGGKSTAPKVKKEGHVICTCFGVTDKEIEQAIGENNLQTVEDVTHFTKAGGGCGGCQPQIQELLDKVRGTAQVAQPRPAARLTTIQKIDRIREVLAKDVKPMLNQDGGDCDLVDVDGNTVYIALTGHCSNCASSAITLQHVVEKALREKVSPELVVKPAS